MFRSSVLVVLLVSSVPLSARAAIYPVTVTTGTGAGSLYAVMNAAADGDTIVFRVTPVGNALQARVTLSVRTAASA